MTTAVAVRMATALVALSAITMASAAYADPLIDQLGPREIAVGDAARAGASGETGAIENPSGIAQDNGVLVFEGGYGYRDSDHASIAKFSACDSTAGLPGCFFYNYVTASPVVQNPNLSYTAQEAGFAGAHKLSQWLSVGSTVKYFHNSTELPGATGSSGFNIDVGATVHPADAFNLGLVGYNLWGTQSSEFPRAIGAGFLSRPFTGFAVSFDALWNLDTSGSTGRYGGGLEYFIRTSSGQFGVPLRIGGVHDDVDGGNYLSGGLGFATMTMAFDVGARKEFNNSNQLLVIASLRFFGPRGADSSPQ